MKKFFRERTFVFGCVVGLVFFGAVLLRFLLYFFGGSLPKLFGKILLMSGLLFWGLFSLLWVFSSTSFLSFFFVPFQERKIR